MDKLNYTIEEDESVKRLISDEYNYVFNKEVCTMLRWGKTKEDNPVWAPFGPEIITVDVFGMSMELFTVIVNVLNTNRTVALVNLIGAKNDNYANYCLENGLTPTSDMVTDSEEDGLFALYVNNEGIVRPSVSSLDGVNIMTVNNLYTDVWHGLVFKSYRWNKLQQLLNIGEN